MTNNDKCPCKNCICLAICASKSRVKCDILRDIFRKVAETNDESNEEMRNIWIIIHEALPELLMIEGE